MDGVLAAWGEPVIVGCLGGGNRNVVKEIRLGGQRLVARRSTRTSGLGRNRPPVIMVGRLRPCSPSQRDGLRRVRAREAAGAGAGGWLPARLPAGR